MELRDVAERGSAPRGSIYHHFPGGKAQLAAEAAEVDGARVRKAIERSLAERGLRQTLSVFGKMFRRRAADHPERIGCPVAAALEEEGVEPGRAATFAGLVVSTIEGALVRTRAAGDHAPLDSAVEGLGQALDALLAGSSPVANLRE